MEYINLYFVPNVYIYLYHLCLSCRITFNFLSLFHWRVATILITRQDQLPLRNVTESVHDGNKLVVIVGSSIVYWAHERVKVLNKVHLDLSCTSVVWNGCRGMKWKSLMAQLAVLQQSEHKNPDLLCIHLGSNDIDSKSPTKLVSLMKQDSDLGVRECPPWCSIVGATVTVHQCLCILHLL